MAWNGALALMTTSALGGDFQDAARSDFLKTGYTILRTEIQVWAAAHQGRLSSTIGTIKIQLR